MEDINIKPVAAGDILSYTIDTELLICIFVKPMDSSYFKCLEKAFTEMKLLMPGYRYLGIQYSTDDNFGKSYSHIPRNLLLLQSVFDKEKAEIWMCGDSKQNKSKEIEYYNRIVRNSIARHVERSISLPVNKRKTKEYKCNIGVNSSYDLVEEKQKKSGEKYVLSVEKEETHIDHSLEEGTLIIN